ncbi:hypothetical protein CBR_g22006 [Chara braunii]|uniref:Myb-like domain-containing protein n=1 Tax=Chara braunii TaxID=69332 RepID=A0A388L1X4_CHABU|nr:hypothetical protein CBR_g22006 [Chara braunii]|eukprot:GBG76258.1 hypothetical protein CBR_g22006 [Chara braunii]
MNVVHHLRCRTMPWPSVGRRVHGLAGDFMRRGFVADVQPLWGRGRCVGVPLPKSISFIRRALSTHVPSLGAVEVGSVARAVRPNIRSVVGRSFLAKANDITHAVERCGGRGRIVEKGLRDRDVAVVGTVYARPNAAHPPLSTSTTAAQDCVVGDGRACPCRCLRDSTGTTVIVIDVGDRDWGGVGSHMFLWGFGRSPRHASVAVLFSCRSGYLGRRAKAMERRSFTDDLYSDLGGSCQSADAGGGTIFCAQPRTESVQSVPSWSYVPQPGVRRGSFDSYGRERSAPQGGNSMAHAPLHSRGFREGPAMACANIWGSPPDLPRQLSQPRVGMMPHISLVPVGRTTGGGCSNHPTPHGMSDQQSAELSAMGGGRVLQGASPAIGEAVVEGAGMGNRGERAEKDDDDGTTSAASDKIDEGVGDRTKPPPVGGRKRKGGSSPRQPKKNNPWSLEERLDLAKFAGEDDALMADAEGAQACMTRLKRWEWVAGRLGDIGYSRTAEDCRKKWAELVKKVGSFIPDDWESLTVDIVGDIVLKLVDNIAEDHDWRLDNGGDIVVERPAASLADGECRTRVFLHVERGADCRSRRVWDHAASGERWHLCRPPIVQRVGLATCRMGEFADVLNTGEVAEVRLMGMRTFRRPSIVHVFLSPRGAHRRLPLW